MSDDQPVSVRPTVLISAATVLGPFAVAFGVLTLRKGHASALVGGVVLVVAGLAGVVAVLVSTHRDDSALANNHRRTKRVLLGMVLAAIAALAVYLLLTALTG